MAQEEDVAIAGTQADVEKTRARTGLVAVVTGDVVIVIAAILGVVLVHNDSSTSAPIVSILSSAFTAVGTLTTAYFGIKATANTAKNSMASVGAGISGDPNRPGPSQSAAGAGGAGGVGGAAAAIADDDEAGAPGRAG